MEVRLNVSDSRESRIFSRGMAGAGDQVRI
jgi:hypothetical protein